MKFTNRKGTIRLYDGTETPLYLALLFDTGDLNSPVGVQQTEEILVLHRGILGAQSHYIEGGDAPVLDPLDIGFSIVVEDTEITTNLLDWLTGEQVNSHTIVTTKGTSTRKGVTLPVFADSSKLVSNLCILWATGGGVGGTSLGFKYDEVYFPPGEQKIAESDDGVNLSLSGKCYGNISRITAFPAGTDVTA
jgi:hypothetical protein